MRIPIIKVRDGEYEHIVGTNSHDVLYVDEITGGIQYLNMQCCEGTKKYSRESSMRFVTEPMEEYDVFGPQIQFVTIEELLELAIQQMKSDTDRILKLHGMMKEYLKEKGICQERLKDDDIQDSGGSIIF